MSEPKERKGLSVESKEAPQTPDEPLKNEIFQSVTDQILKIKKAPENLSLPLSEQQLKDLTSDIQKQLNEEDGINEQFVQAVAETYSITGLKDRLKRFIKHLTQGESSDSDYTDQPALESFPQLAKISSFEIKQTLMKWLFDNKENPQNLAQQNLIGELTHEQLLNFKACYNEFKCITFKADQLFEEERNLILVSLEKNQSFQEISTNSQAHPYLVWQLKQEKNQKPMLIPPSPPSLPNFKSFSLRPPLNEYEQSQVDDDIKDFFQKKDETEDFFID